MRSQEPRGSGRRSGRGPRRSSERSSRNDYRPVPSAPAPKTFWQKLIGFFKPASKTATASSRNGGAAQPSSRGAARKPEAVEVTSPKLYVGNLSYDASESDLFELFKGVGTVKSAEIVTHKYNEKSKGFGFVTMTTTDEAKRAVTELHDKPFMGRKLVVSGSKSGEREPNYRG
jgi:RNA recognition motif-containing protein